MPIFWAQPMKELPCKCGQNILLDDDIYAKLKSIIWSCNGKVIKHNESVAGHMVSTSMGAYIIEIPLGMEVDHQDRNIHNMQRDNLRPATRSQQVANTKLRSDNLYGLRGVRHMGAMRKRPWEGSITKEGKTYRKTFSTAEAAAKWRDQKAIELFGEFAFLNYP